MSNYQRGGRHGVGGPRDHQGLPQNFGASNTMSRMNDRNIPQNRMSPWDISPGNNTGNNVNNMGSIMGNNRGLLPTPNMPAAQGLLPPPTSVQDYQLAAANDMLTSFFLQRQNPQSNQMPSLLGPSPNCNVSSLMPNSYSPPAMNSFNQNFRRQGSLGSQDTVGSNRGTRPNIPSRRSEPYNKIGNRNQRPGQNSDDRKTSNVSPRRAVRGPGLSPKNVVQHARNAKEEKGDSRKNQKTDNSNKEVIDDTDKKVNEKQEHDKIRAEFADIPCDLLSCHVCSKNIGDSVSFVNHIKGKAHLSMMDRQEEQYKAHTEKLRQQMKVEEQKRQISWRQNNRPDKFPQHTEYCAMCNLHFSGNLSFHRKGQKHQELKLFLHPRCKTCDKEFPTRIDFDQHLLTVGHIKTKASLTKKVDANESSSQQESQASHVICQKNEASNKTFVKPEVVMKKPPNNGETRAPLKGILKIQAKNTDSGLSKSIEPEEEKLPEYDSQKEIGMDLLQEKTGYLCRCCNRFLSCSSDAKTHCRSQFHYDKYITYIKSQVQGSIVQSPKQNGNEKSPSAKAEAKEDEKQNEVKPKVDKLDLTKSEEDEKTDTNMAEEAEKTDEVNPKDDEKQDVPEPEEEEEEDDEDEGNWKRRKMATDDDISMDTTIPLNKDDCNKEVRDQEPEKEPPLVKDAKDNQTNAVTEEDTAISSDIEDLEKTLLLDNCLIFPSSPRGREKSSV